VSGIGSHVIAPIQFKTKYNPIKDFTHIAFLGGPPIALVVSTNTPVYDLKGFIEFVNRNQMVFLMVHLGLVPMVM
jgi:tripartite-type tricarboxylate transporter receptor subunit TctC